MEVTTLVNSSYSVDQSVTNTTSPDESARLHDAIVVTVSQRSFAIAFLVLAFFVGTFGNALLLAAIWKYKVLRTSTNIFIASLGVSDLFMSSVLCVFTILSFATNGRVFGYVNPGDEGNTLCKIYGFLILQSSFASISCMLAIAVNRYLCVCRNSIFSQVFTKRRSVVGAFLVHVYSLVASVPPIFGFSRYGYLANEMLCLFDYTGEHVHFLVYLTTVSIAIPFPIIMFCYFKICWTSQKVSQTTANSQSGANPNALHSRESAVTKLGFVVFAAFSILLLPCVISMAVHTDGGGPFGLSTLWFANSALNSVIFGVMNRQLRKAYRKLLRNYCWPRQSQTVVQVIRVGELNTESHRASAKDTLPVLTPREPCSPPQSFQHPQSCSGEKLQRVPTW